MMHAGAKSESERRREPRKPAFLAVGLASDAKAGRLGVTRDLSERGLLIVTPSRFASGERIDVSVHAGDHAYTAHGRVARVDENGVASPELWRYRLAIQLDEPLPAELLAASRAAS